MVWSHYMYSFLISTINSVFEAFIILIIVQPIGTKLKAVPVYRFGRSLSDKRKVLPILFQAVLKNVGVLPDKNKINARKDVKTFTLVHQTKESFDFMLTLPRDPLDPSINYKRDQLFTIYNPRSWRKL